jgi:hypothetical protein
VILKNIPLHYLPLLLIASWVSMVPRVWGQVMATVAIFVICSVSSKEYYLRAKLKNKFQWSEMISAKTVVDIGMSLVLFVVHLVVLSFVMSLLISLVGRVLCPQQLIVLSQGLQAKVPFTQLLQGLQFPLGFVIWAGCVVVMGFLVMVLMLYIQQHQVVKSAKFLEHYVGGYRLLRHPSQTSRVELLRQAAFLVMISLISVVLKEQLWLNATISAVLLLVTNFSLVDTLLKVEDTILLFNESSSP